MEDSQKSPPPPDAGAAPQVKVVDRRWWARGETSQDAAPAAGKPTYVEELESRLAEKDRVLQEYIQQYKAAATEFDESRARARRDVAKEVERGKRAILVDLLEVIDNLDRAIESARDARSVDVLLHGVEMVRAAIPATPGGFRHPTNRTPAPAVRPGAARGDHRDARTAGRRRREGARRHPAWVQDRRRGAAPGTGGGGERLVVNDERHPRRKTPSLHRTPAPAACGGRERGRPWLRAARQRAGESATACRSCRSASTQVRNWPVLDLGDLPRHPAPIAGGSRSAASSRTRSR